MRDPWRNRIAYQQHRPERLLVHGVPGLSTQTLFFLIEGRGEVTLSYDSLKAGKLTRKVRLR